MTDREQLDKPQSTKANKLMEFARNPNVLAIRGLQVALIDAAIALDNAETGSANARSVGGTPDYSNKEKSAAFEWLRGLATREDIQADTQRLAGIALEEWHALATTPAATERQQVDAEHRICQHGRDAFADDCGMCELAGTNWAAPSAESSSATVCPAAKAMPDSPGFMTCCDQMRAGSRTDCTRSPCLALSASGRPMTLRECMEAEEPGTPESAATGAIAAERVGDDPVSAPTTSPTSARTIYQAPSGFKLLPQDPTDAMIRALEGYYAKWQGIIGTSDTERKADCWSALHAYRAMYEAAPITESADTPSAKPRREFEEKPVAWLVERPKGTGKQAIIERELVLSPLTDDTFMDEGDVAWPLFRPVDIGQS